MTEEKNTCQQEELTEQQYREMEVRLFSSSAPVSDLEKICMTLAHIPTEHSQDLLTRFKNSARGQDVAWLDEALAEGQFHYLSPLNEREERDYLALKVMQEIEDEIIDLQAKRDEAKLDLDKMAIKQEAVRELVKTEELDADEELGFHDVNVWLTSRIEELNREISVKEKIFARIKESIQTERYRNLNPQAMRNVQFS